MAEAPIYEVELDEEGMRLDRLLRNRYPGVAYPFILKAIRKGEVRVDGKRTTHNARVVAGARIRIPPPFLQLSPSVSKSGGKKQGSPAQYEQLIVQNIIYRTSGFFAINKPSKLAVQGGNKVRVSVDGLLQYAADASGKRPYLVHRLDKDTSGVLLLANNRKEAIRLTELFKGRAVKKCYLALVKGVLPKKEGVIKAPLASMREGGIEKMVVSDDGKPSSTEYRVLDTLDNRLSLVAFYPITGRKHQIRVHSAFMGCPIIGDYKYGKNEAYFDSISHALHLHAYQVEIDTHTAITAELPKHFNDSLQYLGLSMA